MSTVFIEQDCCYRQAAPVAKPNAMLTKSLPAPVLAAPVAGHPSSKSGTAIVMTEVITQGCIMCYIIKSEVFNKVGEMACARCSQFEECPLNPGASQRTVIN